VTEPAWDLYLRTIVDIEISPGESLRIHPADAVGTWPDALPSPLYILTAWNPGADPLPIVVNRERQRSLEGELAVSGVEMWRAIGRDPDSDYFEEGAAIHGIAEDRVIAAARRYDQDAIFSWSPRAWATVSCRDRHRSEIGWRIERLRSEDGGTPDDHAADERSSPIQNRK
jgi:hypothetical protein